MNYYSGWPYSDDTPNNITLRKPELYHHGIKDMKWYRRRYQNYDGSLTPAGRARYGVGPARDSSDSSNEGRNGLLGRAIDARRQRSEERKAEKEDMKARRKAAEKAAYLRNHPELMTDEEVKRDTERARLEGLHDDAYKNLNETKTRNAKAISELEKVDKTDEDFFSKNKKDMTNDELRDATERRILQKKYEDAVRDLKQSKHPLRNEILNTIGKTAMTAIATAAANAVANKIADKISGDSKYKNLKRKVDIANLEKALNSEDANLTINKVLRGRLGKLNAKDLETAKNMAIDANQLMNLIDKINNGKYEPDKVDGYKKTNTQQQNNGQQQQQNNGQQQPKKGKGKKGNQN